MNLKSQLLELATKLGFDSCRVATCDPPAHIAEFDAWLTDGAGGEMDYLARGAQKRANPQNILPGARSMIILAMNYFQGVEAGVSPANDSAGDTAAPAVTGKIARYARGDDYHGVIDAKLKKIDDFLRDLGGVQKCYVDTGPILERDYAAQAGIGWHGKSTMLINERLGTWFFLAEILTTLNLPPDSPARDRCGTCTRCIDACPTGAITAAHRLDARRCISYLTIELKGAIPAEFRSLIGDRIFGCDDCLEACPWNRFAQVAQESAFSARKSTIGYSLRDYLRLNDVEFKNMFRASPIKRIKRRGFLRNVCVALGNIGTLEDLPALDKASRDGEPLIAEHAAWAIKQIKARFSADLAQSN